NYAHLTDWQPHSLLPSHRLSTPFSFTAPATTETHTLSLHDALPISQAGDGAAVEAAFKTAVKKLDQAASKKLIHRNKAARLKSRDRKSTRLNSSHLGISYAVFCLKKKKKKE